MTEEKSSDRIVVGVDGSEPSITALRRGAQIASAFDMTVEAVAAWQYPVVFDPYYSTAWSPESDAEKVLTAAIDRAFDGDPPDGFSQIVRQGPAARILIEQSAGAFMLVLGSRGHGGVIGLMLGSVSNACAAHARCPVLIMHSPESD